MQQHVNAFGILFFCIIHLSCVDSKILDVFAPLVMSPDDIIAPATGPLTQVELGEATATDEGVTLTVTHDAPSNGFPPGKTIVTWTAIDADGNIGTDTQSVTITKGCNSYKPQFLSIIRPILERNCTSCHQEPGVSSDFKLVDPVSAGSLDINFHIFKNIAAKKDNNGISLIRVKPLNTHSDHGGGTVLNKEDKDYQDLGRFADELVTCVANDYLAQGLAFASPSSTLRKITLALSGRLPSLQEQDELLSATDEDQILQFYDLHMDKIMADEPGFYLRLKEIFNDLLLTDAFPGASALSFDLRNFANRAYFDVSALQAVNTTVPPDLPVRVYTDAEIRQLRTKASYGLAQAPLELIAHIVRENRPFTEILTANYTMVNPYSSRILGVTVPVVTGQDTFEFTYGDSVNKNDADDFRQVVITEHFNNVLIASPQVIAEYPHAGILSSLAFLNRYPNTVTNRNRARSRYVFKYFLDVDIEGLANRADLKLDAIIGDFPPFEDPQCVQCHIIMDPVAGLFKNWRNRGQFLLRKIDGNNAARWPSDRLVQEMLKPGYNVDDLLPATEYGNSLQWLANRVVADNRFALSIVKTVFSGFTGQTPTAEMSVTLESLKEEFVTSNFNLKTLIKAIINTPYFNAENIDSSVNPDDFVDFGMGRLLTPEQLHRKIQAITGGYVWKDQINRNLLSKDTYMVMYGGIDSIDTVERTQEPTAIMAAIQQRIALKTSCSVVPLDLANQGVLFPAQNISIYNIPDRTMLGPNSKKILTHIAYLHKHILGEELDPSSDEVLNTFELFTKAREASIAGNVALHNDCYSSIEPTNQLKPLIIQDASGVVRAWMAVFSYLMLDYKFFYE